MKSEQKISDHPLSDFIISDGIYDCVTDPYDALKNGDPYSSVMPDLVRLVHKTALESAKQASDMAGMLAGHGDQEGAEVAKSIRDAICSHFGIVWSTDTRTQLRGGAEPDMCHPKIASLIAKAARTQILLRLVEEILDDPEREDFTASDMEYWEPLHDRLKAALAKKDC